MGDEMEKDDESEMDDNERTRQAWNANARFWDERMGEGNDFVNVLIWPATLRLLDPQPGQRILEIACGNGLHARRLAAMGAEVLAIDFADDLLALAREKETYNGAITYALVDATSEEQLLALADEALAGEALAGGGFDAVLCQMALFDMADIEPLMRAVPRLLKPGAPFVFTIVHPCFNNNGLRLVAEREDRGGDLVTTYSLNVRRYKTPSIEPGLAIAGQPQPHLYFQRPISDYLNTAFACGFVLDGIEEPAFPPGFPHRTSEISWGGNYSEFPPVLAARLRVIA